jgi:hypothetical protein
VTRQHTLSTFLFLFKQFCMFLVECLQKIPHRKRFGSKDDADEFTKRLPILR